MNFVLWNTYWMTHNSIFGVLYINGMHVSTVFAIIDVLYRSIFPGAVKRRCGYTDDSFTDRHGQRDGADRRQRTGGGRSSGLSTRGRPSRPEGYRYSTRYSTTDR